MKTKLQVCKSETQRKHQNDIIFFQSFKKLFICLIIEVMAKSMFLNLAMCCVLWDKILLKVM